MNALKLHEKYNTKKQTSTNWVILGRIVTFVCAFIGMRSVVELRPKIYDLCHFTLIRPCRYTTHCSIHIFTKLVVWIKTPIIITCCAMPSSRLERLGTGTP